MAKYTPNYAWTMPDKQDYYSVDVFNDNLFSIDVTMGGKRNISDIIETSEGGTGSDNVHQARRNLGVVKEIYRGSFNSGSVYIADLLNYHI